MPVPAATPLAPAAANTLKRSVLIDIEKRSQQRWENEKLFETDSPYTQSVNAVAIPEKDFSKHAEELRRNGSDKWFGTFPYPYMNGSLHLGHAFTISKIEFAAGFERMRGKRVLWPVGFHCTGMPIKAASDKLIREMEMFGENFERYTPPSEATEDDSLSSTLATTTLAPTAAAGSDPSKGKKGKLNAKSTGLTYQFQIMESIGVPRNEIKKFADTAHWLTYFPPIAREDISAFGGRVDWRRSFITTPANPYYDAFVRWQMNKLKKLDYIKFGKRYTIWSAKDNGACMDHDRASGEGVGPQEYTAIKMAVVEWGTAAKNVVETLEKEGKGRKVVMVAATLRPETMYGQTNCFVGPTVTYGLYPSSSTTGSTEEVLYLITARAARNMAFQGLLKEEDKVVGCIGEFKGAELVGTRVTAPNAVHKEVYVLPMDTVSANKGTAVVTCVPSDSPDDYITSLDLRKKAEYYKIDPLWVSLEPVPVLSTPTYGDLTAKTLVEQLRIQSPKDAKPLAEAKELAYKEGFYKGTMIIGEFKGESVEVAKNKVREQMIRDGTAFAYSEPENAVMSRSGDECVVALCDQWYLDYGQTEWKAKAEKLLANMNTYSKETRSGFEKTLDWLKQWACARSYGLGSKLPFAQQFLVESLSDSTIYMSYYTIAHLLHGPPIDGSVVGPLGIKAEDMTDEVWDYIYSNAALPSSSPVPLSKANVLKAEFSYFYPMDIRSSGKDLIPNHLTFCIYVHAALFSEEHWPRSMRANGHLMLNGEKMAKSTGNSLTLKDSLEKYGADATRVTLADAGDTIEDANFEEEVANKTILKLHTFLEWSKTSLETMRGGSTGSTDKNADRYVSGPPDRIWDQIFIQQLNLAIEHTYEAYDKTLYKTALKVGFYDISNARDDYRAATLDEGGMNGDLILRYIEVQALLIAPIAPHFAEHLWSDPSCLGNATSIQVAQFPQKSAEVDHSILEAAEYVQYTLKSIRVSEANSVKKKGKGKSVAAFDPDNPKAVKIYVSLGFPEWQESAIEIVKACREVESGKIDDAKIKDELTTRGLIKDKKYMPFIASFKKRLAQFGPEIAFTRTVAFDEKATLESALPFIRRQVNIDSIDIVLVSEAVPDTPGYSLAVVEAAEPGSPGILLYNTVV